MFPFPGACNPFRARQPHPSLIPGPAVTARPSTSRRPPPQDLLDAAAACFLEKGYAGATLDDVARHMGATKGRIYHYFCSKSELLHAVRRRAMELNLAAIAPAFDSSLPPDHKFLAMARAHALTMITEQAYQKALFDELHSLVTGAARPADDPLLAEFLDQRRRYEDRFRQVLQAGAEQGLFRFDNLSWALHSVLTLLNGTLFWYSPRPGETDADRAAIADSLARMALRAVGGDADAIADARLDAVQHPPDPEAKDPRQ